MSDLTLPDVVADELVLDDGEAVDLTPDEAEAITNRIRRWANSFPVADVVRAYRGRIWVALAYDSWAEWCECELGGLKLPVPQRREVVSELASEGMSNRAIGDVVNVDHKTVGNDLSSVATGENSPVDEDRKTLGQDGRERSYPPPKPPAPEPEPEIVDAEIVDAPPASSTPRRRPITEAARDAGFDLRKAVERIERIAGDDRFDNQKKNVAPHLRGHLTDAINSCQAVLDRINNQ